MPSYRFCRPDDIPFLVRAINECYRPHFADERPMTIERFRDEMKEIDLWPSNSMVAIAGDDPIAVLIGTKRANEVRILRIAARPKHMRGGHGRHVLTSLSQKLAVLGPPRMVAEVPRALDGVGDFFRAVGYRYEQTFTDWLRPAAPAEPVPEGLVTPTSVPELLDNNALAEPSRVAWERARQTLVNRQDRLRGIAIVSPLRIEAYLLFAMQEEVPIIDIFAAHSVDPERRELLLGLLFRHLAATCAKVLRLPRLRPEELPRRLLESTGFGAGESYDLLAARATPA